MKMEASQQGKRRCIDEQCTKMKKKKKESHDQQQRMTWPRMFLNNAGKLSNLTLSAEQRLPLLISDIQNATLFSLIHNYVSKRPRWTKIVRVQKFSHTVTVLVEGVSIADVMAAVQFSPEVESEYVGECPRENKPTEDTPRGRSEWYANQPEWLANVMPRTCHFAQMKVEVMAPSKYNVSAGEELTKVPMSEGKRKKLIKTKGSGLKQFAEALRRGAIIRSYGAIFPVVSKEIKITCNKIEKEKEVSDKLKKEKEVLNKLDKEKEVSDKFDRRKLLLSVQDLVTFGYPAAMEGCPGYKDPQYIFTSDDYTEVTATSPMFGVDCEMCMTNIRQLELTSISVVNEKMQLIYHKLVVPYNPIINYLTQYSGITKKLLKGVTTRIDDVQRDLKSLLPSDAILVGHSLNSDLKVMKVMHPYVIDSSLVYNLSHIRQKRSSLKLLTKQFLGKTIQTGTSGHDPTEDAGASLRLIQLKLDHDITFGDVLQEGKTSHSMDTSHSNHSVEPSHSSHSVEPSHSSHTMDFKHSEDTKLSEDDIDEDSYNYKQDLIQEWKFATSWFEYGKFITTTLLTTPSVMKKNYSKQQTLLKERMAYMEVLLSNKHIINKAAEVASTNKFTYVHMKMDVLLSKCQSVKERRHHLSKLDKRLARIQQSAAPRSLLIFVFSGSTIKVQPEQRSNGFALIGIKDLPHSMRE